MEAETLNVKISQTYTVNIAPFTVFQTVDMDTYFRKTFCGGNNSEGKLCGSFT
jgi:hypothetical protein